MSFHIDDEKLLEKYNAIWTTIEDLKNIKSNSLVVYDDIYIKANVRTLGDKVYTNFRSLNVPEDDIECGSLTVISIDSLLACDKKYYLQVYLGKCPYKVVNKKLQITLMKIFLKIRYYKYCIMIDIDIGKGIDLAKKVTRAKNV